MLIFALSPSGRKSSTVRGNIGGEIMKKTLAFAATTLCLLSTVSSASAGDSGVIYGTFNPSTGAFSPIVQPQASVQPQAATVFGGQVNVTLGGAIFPALPGTWRVQCSVSLTTFGASGTYTRSASVNVPINTSTNRYSCAVSQRYQIPGDTSVPQSVSVSYTVTAFDPTATTTNVLGGRFVQGSLASFTLPQAATVSRSVESVL